MRRNRAVLIGVAAVAVGAIGGLGWMSPARSQSVDDPVELEAVSVDADGAPIGDEHSAPSVSATGDVVVFEVSPLDGEPRVWVRDRGANTTRPVAEVGSVAPGVSGNGCVVAYLVPADVGVRLTVVDRCAAPADAPLPIGTVVDTVDLEGATAGAPALSFDGGTIVWSTGREIRRYTRSTPTAAYALAHEFDVSPVADASVVTGARVDLSADGTAVVFTAGPGEQRFEPTPSNVHVWELDETGTPTVEAVSVTADGADGAAASTVPSISDDGSIVVFDTVGDDLAALDGASATFPVVVVVDRDDRSTNLVVEQASRPAVSADGRAIAYVRGESIGVVTSADRWETSAERPVEVLADAAPVGDVALSQSGRWLLFDSATVQLDDETTTDGPLIWAADLRSSDPSTSDTTTTTTTVAVPPTGVPPTTDPATPTTTDPATPTTTDASTPTSSVASEPVSPTTTVPGGDSGSVTPTVPTATYPRITLPRPTYRPPTTSTRSTTTFNTSSFGNGVTLPPIATPATFEPTIVDAGRRVQPVTLTNPTASAITILSVTVEPVGAFSLVGDGCTGTLAPGGVCSVDVQFAPTEVGPATASVTFQLASGAPVSAALQGTGSPEPTLEVVPLVAGAGQTVTVFGAGFPSGVTVRFVRGGDAIVDQVAVDPDGTFAHVIVVLPNTPTGPMTLSVNGQTDLFDDVSTELLVSTRGSGSADAALRGAAGSSAPR